MVGRRGGPVAWGGDVTGRDDRQKIAGNVVVYSVSLFKITSDAGLSESCSRT